MADRPTVLVIDDNHVDRELVRRYLDDEYAIIEASTAQEGVELALAEAPDCVLLDFRLPDRDGLQILSELVAQEQVVIVLTGQGDEEIAVRTLKGGGSDYLVKHGLSEESLRRAVRFAVRDAAHRRERSQLQAQRDALEENARELLFLLEHTSDFVASLSPNGVLRWVNPKGKEMVGWPGDRDIVGAHISSLQSEEEANRLLTEILPRAARERVWSGELVFRSMSGDDVPTDSVIVVEKDEAGRPAFCATISRDMRGRQRLEAQLQQAQKMEAIGRLAGGIAHDFNNALTAIFSFADFVLESMSEVDPAREDVKEVIGAAKRAEQLTRQLLAFSRKRTIDPKVIDPNETLQGISRMLGRLLGEDLSLDLQCRAQGTVRADVSALEQAVVNLVVNARDAMPGGGVVTIETDDVEVEVAQTRRKGGLVLPGSYVAISISDSGVGMDEETRQHIFEPFFTTKAVGKGTGLGLSTVYGIVKQAGGHISVYSEKGAGTTFRIYLPRLSVRPQEDTRSARSIAPKRGRENVLVVEDDDQIRRIADRTLRRAGYTVVLAADGEEALEIVERSELKIDLLLTDVVMPRMSGKQLADALARRRPELRVLFMSGYTPDAIVHHGLLDEGVDLLHKPFTSNDLTTRVRDALDREEAYAAATSRRRTVLVVDDNPAMLGALRRTLLEDFNVVVASDGNAALEAIKRAPPDIVLCDYLMPHMNGIQLYEAVTAFAPQLARNFVFMTGVSGDKLIEFVKGVDRQVVHKPLERHELLAALESCDDSASERESEYES